MAIKVIRKDVLLPHPVRLSKVHREIEILKTIHHPNIVHLLENIETEKYIGIVLEYASGGELFDFILQRRYLRESMASKLFAQLVSGVSYLHAKGIVHRDLKLENLLLDRNGGIIISDFGFANRFDFTSASNDMMATSCGSPCYAAPELVVSEGLYTGCAVDVWSCGVILYAMLAGYLPYDDDPANPEGDNINLLYRYIVNTSLTFPEYVSAQARTLLKIMLVPNPIYRAKLRDVQKHDWLAAHAQMFERKSSDFEKQMLTADMERSTSARESSTLTHANPRLTSTGNQQVTSRRHTAMPGSFPSKKYEPARRETDLEADVAALAIGSGIANGAKNGIGSATKRGPVPSALARSATTNDRLLPTVSEKSPTTSSPSAHSRLPVPTRRPRPTSYQPVLSLDTEKKHSYSASSTSSHRHRNSYSQPSGSAPVPTPMSVEAEISSPQEVKASNGHQRSHTVAERMNHMVNVPAEPASRRFSLIPSFLSSRDVNGLSVPESVRPKPKLAAPSPKASPKTKDGRAFSKGRKVGEESKTGSSNAAKRVMEFFRRRGVRE